MVDAVITTRRVGALVQVGQADLLVGEDLIRVSNGRLFFRVWVERCQDKITGRCLAFGAGQEIGRAVVRRDPSTSAHPLSPVE